MTLTDRTQRRLRFVLSIAIVGAVLSTSSEVREGVCKVMEVMTGGRSERTRVAPVRDLRRPYARPSIVLDGRSFGMVQGEPQPAVSDLVGDAS